MSLRHYQDDIDNWTIILLGCVTPIGEQVGNTAGSSDKDDSEDKKIMVTDEELDATEGAQDGGGAGNNRASGYCQGQYHVDTVLDMIDRESDNSDSLE